MGDCLKSIPGLDITWKWQQFDLTVVIFKGTVLKDGSKLEPHGIYTKNIQVTLFANLSWRIIAEVV